MKMEGIKLKNAKADQSSLSLNMIRGNDYDNETNNLIKQLKNKKNTKTRYNRLCESNKKKSEPYNKPKPYAPNNQFKKIVKNQKRTTDDPYQFQANIEESYGQDFYAGEELSEDRFSLLKKQIDKSFDFADSIKLGMKKPDCEDKKVVATKIMPVIPYLDYGYKGVSSLAYEDGLNQGELSDYNTMNMLHEFDRQQFNYYDRKEMSEQEKYDMDHVTVYKKNGEFRTQNLQSFN